MASKTLAARGHSVTLIERTMDSGIEIRLGQTATTEIVMALNPDAIFVATGSERLNLPIQGIDHNNVHHVLDVDTGRVDKDWQHTLLKADSIVTAFGMKKNDSLFDEMKDYIPEVYAIGDCDLVSNIKRANMMAFNYAVEC